MGIRRDVLCTICGLAACACASTSALVEAAHPHQRRSWPAVMVDAVPVESDHTHQDYNRTVRIVKAVIVSRPPAAPPPPGRFVNAANWVPQYRADESAWYSYYAPRPQIAPFVAAT